MESVFLLLLIICASALARSPPVELDRGDISSECVLPPCARPINCQRFEPTFTIQNGKKCPGCSRCVQQCEPCLPTRCHNPVTTDVAFSRSGDCPLCPRCPTPSRCPVFRCASPGCDNPKPSFFFLSDGTRCRGCPKCPKVPRCSSRCPKLFCRNKTSGRVITRRGRQCQLCDTCPFPQSLNICPFIRCARPPCRNPQPGRIIRRNGFVCRSCSTCPEPECEPLICPTCVTVDDFESPVDRNGCPTQCAPCKIEEDPKPCPFIGCLAVTCSNPTPGPLIDDRNGGQCRGCSTCPEPECEPLICPACVTVDNFKSPVDANGCPTQCAPCKVEEDPKPCPFIACLAVACPNPVPGRLIDDRQGGRCRTCSTCPSEPDRVPMCPDIFCPACVTLGPGPIVVRNGKRCRTCGRCASGGGGSAY